MTGMWAELAGVAAGTVLILAGVSKIAVPRGLVSTLEGIGLSRFATVGFVRAFGLAEIAIAYSLTAWRHWPVTPAVILLSLAFARSGVLALRRDANIECNCLGFGNSRLGRAQLAMLPAWGLVAVLPLSPQYVAASHSHGLRAWAAGLVLASLVQLVRATGVFRTVSSRRAAMGMPR